MVGDNIDHNPDVFLMASVNELDEFFRSTEVLVDLIEVAGPVSVISTRSVGDDWGDPDSVESHTLNVVQVVQDTLESSTTVVEEVIAWLRVTISFGKSVSDDLID